MSKLYGLIPAAGKGTRAYPYTHRTPKGMLRVNGVPNIQRNIEILRDQLDIRDVCIVTGYYGEEIHKYFGDGSRFGVSLKYVHNEHIDRGLAYSVLLGKEHVDDYFCILLSDECYVDSNHRELLSTPYREALGTCGVFSVRDMELIKRNYSVETEGSRITRLVEKPKTPTSNLLGSGTFLLSPDIFGHLEKAFESSGGSAVDLVTLFGELVSEGKDFRHFLLQGQYTNINDRDSYHLAKYFVRNSILDGSFKHLLVYSEGDEPNIAHTITEYRRDPGLHRISVILPQENSIEETVRQCGADIIHCPPDVTLYGEKIKYAMDRAEGDILILTEANYSFQQRDMEKLYSYLKEADMVIGTRTTRQLVEQGSNMRGIVRLSNIFLAKLIEVLWWDFESRFTDVGCTFRALWRSAYTTVQDNLVRSGPEFSAEVMIELLVARERIIEIPVHYYSTSQSMYVKYQNVSTFWRMLWLIVRRRIKWAGRSGDL
jgi:dTDP-glucose pyrophosphorylase